MTGLALVRTILTCACASMPLMPGQQTACTLEPTEGARQARLSNNVTAKMTWSTCTSIVKDVIFEWPSARGIPTTPRTALERAAVLIREWERITRLEVSPFGDLAKALESRAARPPVYEFGENIPVADIGVDGWDGVWVTLSSAIPRPQLTVHYWANP
jgi:hypothetical protein